MLGAESETGDLWAYNLFSETNPWTLEFGTELKFKFQETWVRMSE